MIPTLKYVKRWLVGGDKYDPLENLWTSILIFYKHNDELILDKSILLIGNLPNHYFSHYINFSGWYIINKKLWKVDILDEDKNIDPDTIQVYIKIGKDPVNINYIKVNPSSDEWYNETLKDHIINPTVIDLSYLYPYKGKLNCTYKDIDSPLFRMIKYYPHLNEVILSRLIINKLN